MAQAGASGGAAMTAQSAMGALYRALVFDADALLAPPSADHALHAVCRIMLCGSVFGQAALLRPGSGVLRWESVHVQGDDDALTQRAEVCEAAARSWERGSVEQARRPGEPARFLVAPVRRAGKAHLLLALRGVGAAEMPAEAPALVGWVAELLGRALDDIDLKASLMLDCARQGYAARHDAVTALPNARAFTERVQREAALAQERGACFAVALLRRGRRVAVAGADDAAVRALAQRLRGRLRRGDYLARIGDDLFGVLLRGLDARQPRQELERLLPVLLQDRGAGAPASRGSGMLRAGLALAGAAGTPQGDLLTLARQALAAAETASGRGPRWRVLQPAPVAPLAAAAAARGGLP